MQISNTQNTTSKKFLSAASLAVIAALSLSAISLDVGARERSFSGTRTGPAGNSVQRNKTVQASDGNRSASSSVQGSNGRGYTRDASRTYDPDTKTVNRSATTTTNSGETFTRNGSTTYNGDGSVSSSGSVTGPNGQSATRTGSTTVTPGGASSTATVTGPNGATATRQGSVVVQP